MIRRLLSKLRAATVLAAIVALLTVGLFSAVGCGTWQGFGKDLKDWGGAIDEPDNGSTTTAPDNQEANPQTQPPPADQGD